MTLTDVEPGVVARLVIGEGRFGGNGRDLHVTLRMHVRHEDLSRWLHRRLPHSRVHGPYQHADGYDFQWMARGPALVGGVLPVTDSVLSEDPDFHTTGGLRGMRERYAGSFARRGG